MGLVFILLAELVLGFRLACLIGKESAVKAQIFDYLPRGMYLRSSKIRQVPRARQEFVWQMAYDQVLLLLHDCNLKLSEYRQLDPGLKILRLFTVENDGSATFDIYTQFRNDSFLFDNFVEIKMFERLMYDRNASRPGH